MNAKIFGGVMEKKKKFRLLLQKDDQQHEAELKALKEGTLKVEMLTKQEELEIMQNIQKAIDAAKSQIPTFSEMEEIQRKSIAKKRKEFADDIAEAITKKQAEAQASNNAFNLETGIKVSTPPTDLDNEIELSSLLKKPLKADDWFEVINDMTRELYKQLGRLPNETQVWGQLWTNPPHGYAITTGKDKGGDDCLNMPSINSLSRSAFTKRWQKYTNNPR